MRKYYEEMPMKKYGKPIGGLLIIFLLFAAAYTLTKNSETLLDYAQKQPEIAYPEQTLNDNRPFEKTLP